MKASIQFSPSDALLFSGKANAQGLSLERHLEKLLAQQAAMVRRDDAKQAAIRRCCLCATLHVGIGKHGDVPQRTCRWCGKALRSKGDRFEATGSANEYLELVAARVSPHRACC